MAETTRSGSGTSSDGGGDELAGAGFDQVIARLRGVVERLETGSLGLEQALGAFEEGIRLSRRGAEILDQAERRVEQLTRGSDGRLEVSPLPPAATGSSPSGAGDGDGRP